MNPRIIKTNEEYLKTLEEVERLISLDPEPATEEAERLDLLSLLVERYESERFPIEYPNPIQALTFRMNEQGLKQRDLIPFIGSKSKVSEVLTGKRPLTVSMIRALRDNLGIPAEVLVQESPPTEQSDPSIAWDKFPLKEMTKRGWFDWISNQDTQDWQSILLRFLKLPGAEPMQALCRRTLIERSGKAMDKYALWAWLVRILTKANSMDVANYQANTVSRDFIKNVLHLSLSYTGPVDAQKYLAKYGICLVIEPHLPRTHLDGAALLSKEGRPIIGLTVRHDRIDNFWFTLVHELVHVEKLLTSAYETFVDDLDAQPGSDDREREADRMASDIIVSREIWARSDAWRQRTPDAVQELALQLRIHPAIVAGRIRHDARNFRILTQMVGMGKVRKFFSGIKWN